MLWIDRGMTVQTCWFSGWTKGILHSPEFAASDLHHRDCPASISNMDASVLSLRFTDELKPGKRERWLRTPRDRTLWETCQTGWTEQTSRDDNMDAGVHGREHRLVPTQHTTTQLCSHNEWMTSKNMGMVKNSPIPKSGDGDVQNIQTTHC